MIGLIKRRKGGYVVERPEYYIQTGAMFENPHGVPPDEIVRFIVENPAEVSAQVVFGKYVESSGLVFTGELIQNLFDRSLKRVVSNSWIDRTAQEQAALQFERFGRFNNRFYTGVDFARQTDFTVITVIDTLPMKHKLPARLVYYKRLNRVPWDTIYAEVGKVTHLFGPNVLCDSTGPGGDSAMDALEGRNYCPKHHRANLVGSRCEKDYQRLDCNPDDYISLSCCEGYDFNGQHKKDLVDHLRIVLGVGYQPSDPLAQFGWLRCPPIPQMEEELAFYAWDDKKLVTDVLFSLALAAWHGLEDRVLDAVTGSVYGR